MKGEITKLVQYYIVITQLQESSNACKNQAHYNQVSLCQRVGRRQTSKDGIHSHQGIDS